MTKIIAIIPARGGSKRIPRKNIIDFLGKPIIAYSIEAALQANIFDEIMVSTDDEEIKEISLGYGARVPFMRSSKTSDDNATTSEVIAEVLTKYEDEEKSSFNKFCCIYPTSPFLNGKKLRESWLAFSKSNRNTLVPVVRYGFPPQRAFIIQNEMLRYVQPEKRNARSQDLPPIYHDAGQFYWCDKKYFRKYKTLVSEDAIPFILHELEVQDIDRYEDLELAKMKYTIVRKGKD